MAHSFNTAIRTAFRDHGIDVWTVRRELARREAWDYRAFSRGTFGMNKAGITATIKNVVVPCGVQLSVEEVAEAFAKRWPE